MIGPWGLLVWGCAPEPSDAPGPAQATSAPAAVEPDDSGALIEVEIARPVVWPGVKQPQETAALFVVLIESALADLPAVSGWVDGGAPSPGARSALRASATRWSMRPGLAAEGDAVRFGFELCDPAQRCDHFEAAAPKDAPWDAVAALMPRVEERLGRRAAPGVAETWAAPLSLDPYAVTVAGRAAATFYGLRDPVPEAQIGDERRDPLARAVYIDPSMPAAWWMVGRFHAAREGWGPAREAFTRASIARPQAVIFRSDEAVALMASGKPEQADAAWVEVDARAPTDVRFVVPRARAAVSAGRLAAATAALDALPRRYQNERDVAELRVRIAERSGGGSDDDALLARWQAAAVDEPEPVRRRIALRLKDARYDEALELCHELDARGATQEAGRLSISLWIGLGQLEQAAAEADRRGLTETAQRIRWRAALTDGAAPADLPLAADLRARVALGERRLADGDASGASEIAGSLIVEFPRVPEAWSLAARAAEGLGDVDAASKARVRWAELEPSATLVNPN